MARLPIYVVGPSIAYIPLTQGQFALVDDWLAEILSAVLWYAKLNRKTRTWYAARNDFVDGRSVCTRMSRVLVGLDREDVWVADHINGRTLDNRTCNLRIASLAQNAQNSRHPARSASGIPGVVWRADKGRWQARIRRDNRDAHLGYYENFDDAVLARRNEAKRIWGEYANHS